MRRRFWLITTLLFVSVLPMVGSDKGAVVSGHATGADLTCASSATLESLAACIRDHMPKEGSNGFVAPNAAEQADWRAVVNRMLQCSCDFRLPASLSGIMQVKTFFDSDNGRNYCVLMEVRDENGNGIVDRGWGTFIVNNGAMVARSELNKAISGWDAAVAQANQTRDFTRKAALEAITYLDLRFSNEGSSFRAYLVNARDTAAQVEFRADMKYKHGARILGKWTPEWYEPPPPSG